MYLCLCQYVDFTRLCLSVCNTFMYAYLDHGGTSYVYEYAYTHEMFACWSTPLLHMFMFTILVLFYVTPYIGTTRL